MLDRQPRNRTLTDRREVSFAFDSGAVCLDFAYTGGVGPWSSFEELHTPADLARWLQEAGIPLPDHATTADLDHARSLRAAIWYQVFPELGGGVCAVDVINAFAAGSRLTPQLRDGNAAWREPTVDAALGSIAADVVAMVGGGDRGRFRQCAADDCTLVFYDISRSGHRRWCAMGRCGNRAKVRGHRRRSDPAVGSGHPIQPATGTR